MRLEDDSSESNEGIPSVLSNKLQTIRVFGFGIKENTVIAFTNEENEYKGACQKPKTEIFKPDKVSSDGFTATYTIKVIHSSGALYLCAKNDEGIQVSEYIIYNYNIINILIILAWDCSRYNTSGTSG